MTAGGGNTKRLEEAVVNSKKRIGAIDAKHQCTQLSRNRLPEMSDATLGGLLETTCTPSRALTSENAPALAERTQHFHTADALEAMSPCTTVATKFAIGKVALMDMLHAANVTCCLWRKLMLLTLCCQQHGRASEYNA